MRLQDEPMVAGVGGRIDWEERCRAKSLAMTKPEKEPVDCATCGRSEEKPARFWHGGEAHGHETQNNEEADRMGCPLSGTVGTEGHEMLWLGRVLGGWDHQYECRPMFVAKEWTWDKSKGPADGMPGPC